MSLRSVALPCAVLAALLLAGCGGGEGEQHDAAAQPDGLPQRDATPGDGDGSAAEDGGLPGEDGPLVGPTSGSIAVDFQATSVSGTGTTRLGPIAVTANAVDYTLLGVAHHGVAYQHHVWAGYTLYDIVSIAADGSDLAVTYLYCEGPGLPWAYTESFTLAMDYEAASGSCAGTETGATVEVAFPALHHGPTAMDTGMTISGADLQLGPGGGWIVLADRTWELVPFNTVDCSTECPGGSWYEIHSMILRPGEACFTILYLHLDSPAAVQLAYTLCLPTLDRPDAVYSADWSGTLLEKQSARLRMWRPAAPPPHQMRELH